MTNVFSEPAELRRELVVVSAVLRCEGRVFVVKGESSMLLVTYCCTFSYGDVGPLPRLVPVALAHLPLRFALCSWTISIFATQFSLAF